MSNAVTIESGPWAGWRTWPKDIFETNTGPFYTRREADGRLVSVFIAEQRHMNGGGFMHGGCMLTFADYACFAIYSEEAGGGAGVTVNLSGDFLSPVSVGDRLEAVGEVTRAGGRLIYVRGLITTNGKPCLSFTSVITRVRRDG
jgi:uncharacterized protein (TIGR00369 family)